ncbi:hypothetical protein ABGB18_40890 [Nonomuraea sp. B12E4]|uniref:hypothetical protein n=1 Tax=Nonomuraea sp. B12E4 TaxID=3153564 RepID=UPI00325EEAD8
MRYKRYKMAAFSAAVTGMFMVPMAASAEASAPATAVTKAAPASAAVICPVKVVRTTRRYAPRADGSWTSHSFFRKGSQLGIYQGETRKILNGIVVVKTTTVVGGVRFWVRQADIVRTGGACMS